jgi:hypothetical protein
MLAKLTARDLRRRVLRPTEGVFLFHPRVVQRLVRRHLGDGASNLAIPSVGYYLMPRKTLLIGLEDENPDALAIIEGLDLPDWMILLPMPSTQELAVGDTRRWLRDYWGRRFEAEVARAWQVARNDNQDHEAFGARGLTQVIGERGFREARALLEQDRRVAPALDDAALCVCFVGFVVYLRYFVPGSRAYFFPAIQHWDGLDRWLKDGGLDLPPPRHGSRWPQLLTRSRPSGFDGAPDYEPELPLDLPFGRNDPDLADGANTILPLLAKSSPTSPTLRRKSDAGMNVIRTRTEWDRIGAWIETHVWEALRQASALTRNPGGLAPLWRVLTGYVTPLVNRSATLLEQRFVRRSDEPPPWALTARLHLFQHAVQTAFKAEMAGHYGTALRYLCVASDQYRQIARRVTPDSNAVTPGDDSFSPARVGWKGGDRVTRTLEERQHEIVEALAHNLAATWKLDFQSTRVLEALIERLLDEPATARLSSPHSRLLHDLERIFLEGRTIYYRLQPLVWLWSGSRQPLRLGLPFQGPLKALRALNAAKTRLGLLPWSGAEVAYFSAPLRILGEQISQRLHPQLQPRLRELLDAAGFCPSDPRRRVAWNALQEELLAIILQRGHLRFTDLRDAVARHELRLPDSGWRELLFGDRLARFDRRARAALPGVYQPGEFYLKGLQQANAPLFGTITGRWITRWVLLPFGIAFIGLETLGFLLNLVVTAENSVRLVHPGSVLGIGVGLIILLYTERGWKAATAFANGCRWLFAEVLSPWLVKGLRWSRTHWLHYPVLRQTSRYLLEPLLIGLVFALPLIGIANNLEVRIDALPVFLLMLGFILGSVLRNSQSGRRILDSAIGRFDVFWRQMHRTLLIGLFRWVVDLFRGLMHGFEQGLHRVDEQVSHHRDEGRSVMVAKAIIGPVWRTFSYLIHFYVAVLVEPQVNPVKHFPVVTVADKLMLPFFPALTSALLVLLDPILPRFMSLPLATVTVLLSPGLFGFLAWELKENWRLYRANHPDRVQPAHFGPNGETLYTLLRPGFYSGALPDAFAELRQVIGRENEQEQPHPESLRQAEARLSEILEALRAWVDRELGFALLERCRTAGYARAEVVLVRIAVATAALDLRVALYPEGREGAVVPEPIRLDGRFELRADQLEGETILGGPVEHLGPEGGAWLKAEAAYFLARAGVKAEG